MKLTNSQRADYLARFVAAQIASASSATCEDDFSIALDFLAMFEREISKWPDETPATIQSPVTSAIRNPENIDFNTYPIPPGYTVASDVPKKSPVELDDVGSRRMENDLLRLGRLRVHQLDLPPPTPRR